MASKPKTDGTYLLSPRLFLEHIWVQATQMCEHSLGQPILPPDVLSEHGRLKSRATLLPDSVACFRLDEQNHGSFVLLKRRLECRVQERARKIRNEILRYRRIARQIATDPNTARHIKELIADLERQLREIDE